MKKYVFISFFIYCIGFATAFYIKDNFAFIKQNQLSLNVDTILKQTNSEMFLNILKNNTFVFFTSIFGFLTFGLLTAITTFYNGFVFGYLLITINRFESNSMIIHNILPHSIEIIGLLISSSIGFYLSNLIFNKVFLNKNIQLKIKQISYTFILGYSLIILAALIESYVSTK